jgi:hypothetical protein
MLMNLLNPTGERTEAVLLATGNYHMRVVIRGSTDTTELRLVKDQWMSEDGVAVDIELLVASADTNDERPRTMSAGS